MSLSFLMKEYLRESPRDQLQESFGITNKEFPIEPQKDPVWKTLEKPQRLSRTFSFRTSNQVLQFVKEILQYENSVSHNGSIKIEGKSVLVEVYTHALEEITELDVEYAEELSQIYKDVKDYEQR